MCQILHQRSLHPPGRLEFRAFWCLHNSTNASINIDIVASHLKFIGHEILDFVSIPKITGDKKGNRGCKTFASPPKPDLRQTEPMVCRHEMGVRTETQQQSTSGSQKCRKRQQVSKKVLVGVVLIVSCTNQS